LGIGIKSLQTPCVLAKESGTKRKKSAKSGGGKEEQYGGAKIYSLQQARPKILLHYIAQNFG
jgi:hypothetical protein